MANLARNVGLFAVFISISLLGVYTIFGNFYLSGALDLNVSLQCPEPPSWSTFAQIHYTGITPIDLGLCQLVSFYNAGLNPTVEYYLAYFLLCFVPAIAMFQIEGTRKNKSKWINSPIYGFLYQFGGGGCMVPLEMLVMTLSSAPSSSTSRNGAPQPLTANQAYSVFFGVAAGYVLPTFFMLKTKAQWSIVVWQFLPIWVNVLQSLWLLFTGTGAGSKNTSQNHNEKAAQKIDEGFKATRTMLYIFGLLSAVVHITTIRPQTDSRLSRIAAKNPLAVLQHFLEWLPPFSVTPNSATTVAPHALQLLQWDSIWMFVSVIVGGVVLQDQVWDLKAAFVYTTAVGLGSIFFGPGAVIAGLWIYREASLAKKARSQISKAKAQ